MSGDTSLSQSFVQQLMPKLLGKTYNPLVKQQKSFYVNWTQCLNILDSLLDPKDPGSLAAICFQNMQHSYRCSIFDVLPQNSILKI